MAYETSRLGNFEVTPADFAGTYYEGDEIFDLFSRFSELAGGISDSDIARELGVNEDRIRSWLNGIQPRAIRGLVRLHALDIFKGKNQYTFNPSSGYVFDVNKLGSLTADHPSFELLCFISTCIHWAGTQMKRRQRKSPQLTGAGGVIKTRTLDSASERIIKKIIRELRKLSWCGKEHSEPSYQNRDGLLDNRISRLIGLLGLHLGRKKYAEEPFPHHIHLALESLGDDIPPKERAMAHQLLRDFFMLLVLMRCSLSETRGYSCRLVSTTSPQIRERQGRVFRQVIEAGGFGHLDIRLYPDVNAIRSYRTAVIFSGMENWHLDLIREEVSRRVDELTAPLTRRQERLA